ncbi:hypothetical protein X759_28665 [Mesorhizobium sp. LSHC420B00]|nr:hypothetical protein X759_28665 [Mesorhizobium sp. LSHC420B00]
MAKIPVLDLCLDAGDTMANDVWRTSCIGRDLESVMHSGPKAEDSKLIAAEAEGR